jgi:hypothetical protein
MPSNKCLRHQALQSRVEIKEKDSPILEPQDLKAANVMNINI